MTTRVARRPQSLRQLYAELNQRYFGGRLPPYRIVRNLSVLGDYAGQCNWEHGIIRIMRGMSRRRERQVLLHEMIHVAVGGGHGAAFLEQLSSLAGQGERWAERERAGYIRDERRCVRLALAAFLDVPRRAVSDELVALAIVTHMPQWVHK